MIRRWRRAIAAEPFVRDLVDATDRMATAWAETNPNTESGQARRRRLWSDVHHAADIAAAALDEGPKEARRMNQAVADLRAREAHT